MNPSEQSTDRELTLDEKIFIAYFQSCSPLKKRIVRLLLRSRFRPAGVFAIYWMIHPFGFR